MPRASRNLVPPPRRPNDGPPLPPELYVEPAEEILVIGEMLHDVATMHDLLAGLPFDREHYRASLRIVAGAALRTRQRCERLLGEVRVVEQTPVDLSGVDLQWPGAIIPAPAAVPEPVREALPPAARTYRRGPATAAGKSSTAGLAILSTLKELGTASTKELVQAVVVEHDWPAKEIEDALAALRIANVITTTRLGKGILNRIAE